MQQLKRMPAVIRPQQANNKHGRNGNRRDHEKSKAAQGSRNAAHGW